MTNAGITHNASDLYEAHIPVGAIPKEPCSVKEIDEHPDASRIWVTIKVVREYTEAQGYEDGYGDCWSEWEDANGW